MPCAAGPGRWVPPRCCRAPTPRWPPPPAARSRGRRSCSSLDPAAHDASADAPPLELRVQRIDGVLHFDWFYDPARLDEYSVQEMAEQFPLALIEITSDAGAPL